MLPDKLLPISGSAECPTCGQRVAGGHIVRTAPQWDETEGSYVSIARFFCDPCHQVVSWQEWTDRLGQFQRPIPKSCGVIRDPRAVELFCRRHPRNTGVQPR